jgi:simple sugar transport system ATP-binding protein
MRENIIRTEKIEKSFGRVHALRGVSFSVDKGEVVGLVGENGAGKSTLIKTISGLYPPDRGKIFWKGKEVKVKSVKKARELGIETVHQGGLTIGILSVSDNIFLTREVKKSIGPIRIIDRKKQQKIAAQLTSELGLGIKTPEQEVRLCSGGERQGTAIARALQFNSELLILDEPTDGLAPSGRRKIVDFVNTIRQRKLGCIFSTPDVYLASPVADRFIVLVDGRIVEEIENTEDLDLEEVEEKLRIRR